LTRAAHSRSNETAAASRYCKKRNIAGALCTRNLYQIDYVASATENCGRKQQQEEHTMRKFFSVVLPIIAAASVSGLMFTATIA
jgi:hypothetical protein